jgi:hypothetical protein
MRQACHMRLRSAVYHWARVAIQHDELSRRRYAELRRRGHSHGRALRSVADRLLAVACAMLTCRTLFDQQRAARKSLLEDNSHSFVRSKRRSLRPDLATARALRAGAVEDAACGTGETGAKRPRRR